MWVSQSENNENEEYMKRWWETNELHTREKKKEMRDEANCTKQGKGRLQ